MPSPDRPSPGPGELDARTADLADAEARYHATLGEPAASEADRTDAAENLDRAQTRMRELTFEAPGQPGLQAAQAGLDEARERYYATLDDESGAGEAARNAAVQDQERARARVHELTFSGPAPGAELVGHEVRSAQDGSLLGPVEQTRHLAYCDLPAADVVMVRHIHGDGQLRAYELSEIREYVIEGKVTGARPGLEPDTEPEAEAEAEI